MIHVVVTIQDPDGVSQSDLDSEYLKALELWTIARTKINAIKALKAQGQPAVAPSVVANSVYAYAGPTKLAVIRLTVGGSVAMVSLVGIIGSEMRHVGCVRESVEPIPITLGPCGEKIKEIFDAEIGAP